MTISANAMGKMAMLALGAAGLAFPLYGLAQEHDHASHAGHGEAAAPVASAPLSETEVTASRTVFSQNGCGMCHVLADAGGSGHIGPALDGNSGLSVDYVRQMVSNGQGAMPSFGGMMSEAQIDTLARYIVEKKR